MTTQKNVALLMLGLIMSAGLATAGPLSPPAGPVAPTGKTLTEVEPRIAINATNTPGDAYRMFRITQPGSYYLTGNLVSSKGIAIEIEASNVTLDLSGFTISTSAASPQYAIFCFTDGVAGWKNITIRNGVVAGNFVDSAVSSDAKGTQVDRVTVTAQSTVNGPSYGLAVGSDSSITNCIVDHCKNGIAAGSRSTVEDCFVRTCATTGVSAVGATVKSCTVSDCNTGIAAQLHAVVEHCTLRDNFPSGGAGIRVVNYGSRIDSNTISGSWSAISLDASATDNLVIRNTVRKGGATGGITMNGQAFGSYPNNHVAQSIVDPASPFTATNPFANIQY